MNIQKFCLKPSTTCWAANGRQQAHRVPGFSMEVDSKDFQIFSEGRVMRPMDQSGVDGRLRYLLGIRDVHGYTRIHQQKIDIQTDWDIYLQNMGFFWH